MSTHGLSVLVCVLIQSIAGLAAAAPPAAHPAQDRYRAWRTIAIQLLTQRGDENSLATAALLRTEDAVVKTPSNATPDNAALVLASRATDLAPDSTSIGWIRLRVCALAVGCDIRGSATEMRWLDPDNGAAWLPTLAAAQKDGDTMEIDRVLRHMAEGTRVDFYWNRIVILIFDALKAVSKGLPGSFADSDAARLAYAERIAAIEIVPHVATLIEACRDSRPATGRRESCLKVSRILRNGDTIGAQLVGIGLEKHFASADGKDARALTERRRVLEWRLTTAAEFDRPLLPWLKSSRARWRLARMRTMRRQEDVCIAVLRERGLPLDPPPASPPPQLPLPPEPLHLRPP